MSAKLLPALEEALRSRHHGIGVAASMEETDWPAPASLMQTVILAGNPGSRVPSCVPPEALDCSPGDYVDEYGSSWHYQASGRGWYVIHRTLQDDAAAPLGARRWPLKRCESEVARQLGRSAASARKGSR